MIYITGDCHGDWRRFSTDIFPEQKEMCHDDFVIVCGDFGIWNDTKEERWWLEWLSDKSFTTLFVDGNHENFDRLNGNEFEVVDFHGGKAHRIRENIYHLMRGHIFDLCGKSFFAFGGASSHDIKDGILDPSDFSDWEGLKAEAKRMDKQGKLFRIKGMSWWPEEIPSEDEMAFGLKTLEEHNNKVDYVVSHCCPQHVASIFSHGFYKPDVLTGYFNTVAENVQFDEWFFGHYHDNRVVMGKFCMLYEQIIRVV